MIRVETLPDPTKAAHSTASFLNKTLAGLEEKPVFLGISGGSALQVLEDLNLSLFEQVTVGFLDERISSNPGDRNWNAVQSTDFYEFAKMSSIRFLPVRQRATPEESAREYNENLHTWFAEHSQAVLVLLLGIGPDGHTAGIMPFPENPK